jgi:sigma-54 dependent transcriptional regulator, acetoin dehydrogenase operon transcriptional activator AcoR
MKGLIAQSDGGSLFLDEIGDMPLALQTRLLRVLSESEVLPLGAERPTRVTLHVMAATHRDLRESVAAGTFREDLYYRLCGATLSLPALRERQDKSCLIARLCADEAQGMGLTVTLGEPALRCLLAHDWPGNVRELRNALRFALALRGDGTVLVEDLPPELRQPASLAHHVASPPPRHPGEPVLAAGPADPDAARLLHALQASRWNITAAARALQVCRATVYRQMQRHHITPPHLS